MIPGTSRSGATIIGALLLGVSRPLATEFSFYLAIPTMFGATLLKLLKGGVVYTKQDWNFHCLSGSIYCYQLVYELHSKKRFFFIWLVPNFIGYYCFSDLFIGVKKFYGVI